MLSLPVAALVKVAPGVRLSWLQVRATPAVILRSRVVRAVLALAVLFALPQVAAPWAVAAVTCSSLLAQTAKVPAVKHVFRVVTVILVVQ